jgi:hypothetical protein
MHLFLADIAEISVVTLAPSGNSLVIQAWHEGLGYSRTERE